MLQINGGMKHADDTSTANLILQLEGIDNNNILSQRTYNKYFSKDENVLNINNDFKEVNNKNNVILSFSKHSSI